MTNILFICGKARMRSPTAADIARRLPNIHADFAGLSNDADELINSEHLEWADIIAVMERRQLARLKRHFPTLLRGKRTVCLGVPDKFEYMQPELVALLNQKMPRLLGE